MLIVALCGVVPALAVIDTGAPGALVIEKFTVVTPEAAAGTVWPAHRRVGGKEAQVPRHSRVGGTVIVSVKLPNRTAGPRSWGCEGYVDAGYCHC